MSNLSKTPDWLRLQKMIFKRFINQSLKQGGRTRRIDDVITDMANGMPLLELIEVMSGKKYSGKTLKESKLRVRMIDNINQILNFVKKDCSVSTKVVAEDLADGNETSIMGLVFAVILKYLRLDEDDDESGDIREALKLWLSNKTAGYAGVEIDSLTKSFYNGLAFNALIHKMRPKLVDYDALSPGNKEANLQQALELGEKYLNIEKFLEPSDIPKLNEVSMVIYLTDWYNGITLLQKQDIAARRIGKLVEMTILHDNMRAEYREKATTLVAWVDQKIVELSKNEFDNTLEGVQALMKEFYDYKEQEKSSKIVDHISIVALYNNLALRLANHKRPAFKAGGGLDVEDLEAKFESLEAAEVAKGGALNNELARQLKLKKVAARFKEEVKKLKDWGHHKAKEIAHEPKIELTHDAEDAIDDLGFLTADVANSKKTRLSALSKLLKVLVDEDYQHKDEVSASYGEMGEAFEGMEQSLSEKKTALEAELARQQGLDATACQEFADAVKAFQDFVKSKRAALSAGENTPLEDQLATLVASMSDMSEADSLIKTVSKKSKKQKKRGLAHNPHTNITAADVRAQWKQYELLVAKKKELLEQEIEESKRAGLTEEQMKEITDNFKYFDKDGDDKLTKRELRACLQSLGEESNPQAVKAVLDEFDGSGDGNIQSAEFMQFMIKQLGDSDSKEEIIQSFKYLAYEKDTVTASNLETVVNNKSFKDMHVDYLKKEMKECGDGYDYPTWTKEAFDR